MISLNFEQFLTTSPIVTRIITMASVVLNPLSPKTTVTSFKDNPIVGVSRLLIFPPEIMPEPSLGNRYAILSSFSKSCYKINC